jgi:transposase
MNRHVLVIARFVLATKPEIRPLPDEAARFLNDLVSRRRQIIAMIVAEKQREKRLSNKRLQQSIARLVKALEKELFVRTFLARMALTRQLSAV